MKHALITGISGQDGSYLADLLLRKGYRVWGTTRNLDAASLWRLKHLGILGDPMLEVSSADFSSVNGIRKLIERVEPDEIYNLAATSFVPVGMDQLENMAQATGLNVLRILEAVREVNPAIKFYQAGSSEMFGQASESPQSELTSFRPRNPYGVAKLYSYWNTVIYRESYGIFACNGILFNHESPLRGELFVTRKITLGLAALAMGSPHVLELGNLDACRDWGYAPEYVDGMWRMLQHNTADCYVLSTGRSFSVRQFVSMSAKYADISLNWQGKGSEEVGIDNRTGKVLVRVNPSYYRKLEPLPLVGNAAKAETALGWRAQTPLEDICRQMVEADLERARFNCSGKTGC